MAKLMELFALSGVKRGYMVNYNRIVRARLHAFELDERFYIRCSCSSCGHEVFMPSWDIADVLRRQCGIKCYCEEDGMLPVLREKAS